MYSDWEYKVLAETSNFKIFNINNINMVEILIGARLWLYNNINMGLV